MSATGQGGLTQISLTLAAAGTAGSKYTFTHNVGSALQASSITDSVGNPISGVSVLQTSLNACVIQNLTSSSQSVLVTLQWAELSPKLDVVKSTDSRLTSGTAAASNLTLYVETTGSDSVGDGTQAAPFKTIQRALDVIPDGYGAIVIIQLGAGTFAPGYRFPKGTPGIWIFGDRSQPVADLSAVAFSLVAGGSKCKYRGNAGVAFNAAVGQYWIESSIDGYPFYSRPVIASTSPNIDCIGDPDVSIAEAVALHPYVTTILPSTDSVQYFNGEISVPYGVYYIGVLFSSPLTYTIILSGGGGVVATSETEGLNFNLNCYYFSHAGTQSEVFMGASTNNPDSATAIITGQIARLWCRQGCAPPYLFEVLLFTEDGASPVVNVNESTLSVYKVDVEGTLAKILFSGTNGTIVFNEGVFLATSSRTSFITWSGGRITRAVGTMVGTITGNCVTLSNGAHATGLETACSGNLANGSTPGNEIVVGGNAVTTFAALPTTDLAAGSPQLCRAT
jgi:hypothetical protein